MASFLLTKANGPATRQRNDSTSRSTSRSGHIWRIWSWGRSNHPSPSRVLYVVWVVLPRQQWWLRRIYQRSLSSEPRCFKFVLGGKWHRLRLPTSSAGGNKAWLHHWDLLCEVTFETKLCLDPNVEKTRQLRRDVCNTPHGWEDKNTLMWLYSSCIKDLQYRSNFIRRCTTLGPYK